MLPEVIGGIAWRLFISAALLGALAWWLKSACSKSWTDRHRAWLLLLTIPMMQGNLNSAQANALVVACLLAALAAINESRWNIASAVLAVAFLIKGYPLAVALLLIVLYPKQLGWRLPIAIALGFLTPFLVQEPGYVMRQYDAG